MFGLKKKLGGEIGFLHLEKFWYDCSSLEQNKLQHYASQNLTTGARHSTLTQGTITGSSITPLKFLIGMLTYAESDKQYVLCDKLIKHAELSFGKASLVDQHFFLQTAAEVYYKQREIREDAIELCEKYCQRDIDLFPKYKSPLIKDIGVLPNIKTFQRLAILYEKRGDYTSAIQVCKLALKYGLSDGTQSGYEGRMKKLEKKTTIYYIN